MTTGLSTAQLEQRGILRRNDLPLLRIRAAGMEPLLDWVSHRYSVTVARILGPRRHAYIMAARHAFWCELRWHGCSYSLIARLVGKDHTTVLNGVAAHRRKCGLGHLPMVRVPG